MIFQVATGTFRVPSSQDKEAQMYRKKRFNLAFFSRGISYFQNEAPNNELKSK